MVLQFACAKSGLILYNLDITETLTSSTREKAQEAIRAALTLSEANVFILPEHHNDVNYLHLMRDVMPETRMFDVNIGLPFFSPGFPHVRMPIHTGFDFDDDYPGFYLLKHMVVPSNNLEYYVDPSALKESTPLVGQFVVEDHVPVKLGKPLTHAQVVEQKHWPTYAKVLAQEFHQVPGVGVIF
jgi:hypothetical protein